MTSASSSAQKQMTGTGLVLHRSEVIAHSMDLLVRKSEARNTRGARRKAEGFGGFSQPGKALQPLGEPLQLERLKSSVYGELAAEQKQRAMIVENVGAGATPAPPATEKNRKHDSADSGLHGSGQQSNALAQGAAGSGSGGNEINLTSLPHGLYGKSVPRCQARRHVTDGFSMLRSAVYESDFRRQLTKMDGDSGNTASFAQTQLVLPVKEHYVGQNNKDGSYTGPASARGDPSRSGPFGRHGGKGGPGSMPLSARGPSSSGGGGLGQSIGSTNQPLGSPRAGQPLASLAEFLLSSGSSNFEGGAGLSQGERAQALHKVRSEQIERLLGYGIGLKGGILPEKWKPVNTNVNRKGHDLDRNKGNTNTSKRLDRTLMEKERSIFTGFMVTDKTLEDLRRDIERRKEKEALEKQKASEEDAVKKDATAASSTIAAAAATAGIVEAGGASASQVAPATAGGAAGAGGGAAAPGTATPAGAAAGQGLAGGPGQMLGGPGVVGVGGPGGPPSVAGATGPGLGPPPGTAGGGEGGELVGSKEVPDPDAAGSVAGTEALEGEEQKLRAAPTHTTEQQLKKHERQPTVVEAAERKLAEAIEKQNESMLAIRKSLVSYQKSRDDSRQALQERLLSQDADRGTRLRHRLESGGGRSEAKAMEDLLQERVIWYHQLLLQLQEEKLPKSGVVHYIIDTVRAVLEHGDAFGIEHLVKCLSSIENSEVDQVVAHLLLSIVAGMDNFCKPDLLAWFENNRGEVPRHLRDTLPPPLSAEQRSQTPIGRSVAVTFMTES